MSEGNIETVRVEALRVIVDRYKRHLVGANNDERQVLSRIISDLDQVIEQSLVHTRRESSNGFSRNSLLVQ